MPERDDAVLPLPLAPFMRHAKEHVEKYFATDGNELPTGEPGTSFTGARFEAYGGDHPGHVNTDDILATTEGRYA